VYITELHYCCDCGIYLGIENGDGICSECEEKCYKCGTQLPEDEDWTDPLCPNCAKTEHKLEIKP